MEISCSVPSVHQTLTPESFAQVRESRAKRLSIFSRKHPSCVQARRRGRRRWVRDHRHLHHVSPSITSLPQVSPALYNVFTCCLEKRQRCSAMVFFRSRPSLTSCYVHMLAGKKTTSQPSVFLRSGLCCSLELRQKNKTEMKSTDPVGCWSNRWQTKRDGVK